MKILRYFKLILRKLKTASSAVRRRGGTKKSKYVLKVSLYTLLSVLILVTFAGIYNLFKFQPEAGEYILGKSVPKQTTFQLPILMYHHIQEDNPSQSDLNNRLSVLPSEFENQLKYLNENNFLTLASEQVVAKRIPSNAVWLTFDDGYSDNFQNTLPLLKKYQAKATFFIISSKVGESGYMNWQQIEELKNAGMEIGCHSQTHPNLTSLSETQIKNEIEGCKKDLEEKLGVAIVAFCYPVGEYNQQIVEVVKQAGFTTATTTNSGIANQDSNLYELPRIRINPEMSLESFIKVVNVND